MEHCEQKERGSFTLLSTALKKSQQKEKIYSEKTKYWSLMGSLIGTAIGLAGSGYFNHVRMRTLQENLEVSHTDCAIMDTKLTAIINMIKSNESEKNHIILPEDPPELEQTKEESVEQPVLELSYTKFGVLCFMSGVFFGSIIILLKR
jgi:hypothetical protein